AGKWANFLITSGPIFNDKTTILQNWIQGTKYSVREKAVDDARGIYKLVLNTAKGKREYTLEFKSNNSATILDKDSINTKFSWDGAQVKISFAPTKRGADYKLSGFVGKDGWTGVGYDTSGHNLTWTAHFEKE